MIGLVLAAGAGRRLGPLTADLPKTLLEIGAARTVLDVVVANFAAVGIDDVAIVTGFAAAHIEGRARLPVSTFVPHGGPSGRALRTPTW